MHDAAFADATRPTPVVCLKLPLREYSIGHELLLLRRRNPLLWSSEADFNEMPVVDQRAAVVESVWICANTWRQNCGEWFAGLKLRIWCRRLKKENFPLAVADFRNYLREGQSFPRLTPPDEKDSGRELGSPLLARLYHFVAINYKVREPLDFPLGMAHWLYFSALETAGQAQVENRMEQQIREETEQHIRDIEAERAAKSMEVAHA